MFASGAVSEAEATTFPIDSAHMAILATSGSAQRRSTRSRGSDTAGGCCSHKIWTAALLDVCWTSLDLRLVAPDIYIAAAHAIADRTVLRRQQPKLELASLTPHPPPYSPEEIHSLQTQVPQRGRQRQYRSRADMLRTAAITGATRRAHRLPTVRLQPFTGLAASPDNQPVTRGAGLAEVNAQAAYVQEDRWVLVDVRAVSDATSWYRWPALIASAR